MSAVPDSCCFPSSLTTTGYIKLLKLQQDRQDKSIACTLETVRLRDNPHYLALSYIWGPLKAVALGTGPSLGHEESPWILCNEAVVKITRNLHDFLQRACSEPELCSQRFWIDSVCINQLDAQERCAQVSSMASIYRSADCVVAWLGEEEADTETAFALITKLANLSQDLLAKVIPKNFQSPDFKEILGPLADDIVWEALRQFWRRSYFTRAWIIQELVLARKSIVRCGQHVVDWNFVVRTSKFLTTTAWSRLFNSGIHDPTDPEYSHHAQPLYIHVNSKMSSANSDRSLLLHYHPGTKVHIH